MAMLNNQRVSFLDTFGKAIHWSNHTWKIFMVRKSPFMGFSWVAFSQVQNDPLPNHFLIPVFCFKSSFFRFTILNNIFFLDGATPMTALRPFIAGGGESVAELLEVKGIMSHHIFWDSYQPSSIFHAMGSVFFFFCEDAERYLQQLGMICCESAKKHHWSFFWRHQLDGYFSTLYIFI